MVEGRIQIKDMTHSTETSFVEKIVKQARKDFSDANIFTVLDNFHKYEDFKSADERVAAKKRSGYLKKQVAQHYDVTLFSTAEYKKIESGLRPKNSDIGETGQLEYDTNLIAHLFNALKAAMDSGKEASCDLWHGNKYDKMPIVEMDIGKNKICESKGTRHYLFYPAQSRYRSLAREDLEAIVADNRAGFSGGGSGSDGYWMGGKKILYPTKPNLDAPDAPPNMKAW